MSYNDEKLLILKMLQEGKITPEEAMRLLNAIQGTPEASSSGHQGQDAWNNAGKTFNEEIFKLRKRLGEWRTEFSKNYPPQDFEKIMEDFASKAEKVGQNVASTTFGAVDKIIDYVGSIIDTGSFNFFAAYPAYDKVFETLAKPGANIEIQAVNGAITVRKHASDKIAISTTVRSPESKPGDVVLFNPGPDNVSLKLVNESFSSVTHLVLLPSLGFGDIRLSSKNGKIRVEDAISATLSCTTRNAAVELVGVTADHIITTTKNARVALNYVTGKNIEIHGENSVTEIKDIKTKSLKVVSSNGKIQAEGLHTFDGEISAAMLELKTEAGDIKVIINDSENRAVKISAHTGDGDINLLVPGLKYTSPNVQTSSAISVGAETEDYASNPGKIDIFAETKDGYIEIVK